MLCPCKIDRPRRYDIEVTVPEVDDDGRGVMAKKGDR